MARLHEYQGKALLAEHGLTVPAGRMARTPAEARDAAAALGGTVILKVQAWITGRAARGGVLRADDPAEAETAAARLLTMRFGNFPVEEVLVEEVVDIRRELFVSLTIDDASRAPMLLLDCAGGSGIEERAASVRRLPVDLATGVDADAVRAVLADSPVEPALHDATVDAIRGIVEVARAHEARSLEVNPLVTTGDGRVCAADCRMTIDDYAVFRHPELGIEIARELDHPVTALERIAYGVEQADHRGTFYFAQLPTDDAASSRGLIGFHGAGGGGSMMSMDAVTNEGFTLANFCDTSGNPSSAKVYRAARIILAQPGLVGYFGSGSGVASQEQYHSAYGLAKAFGEMGLTIPVVIRLGGNSEDRAVEILQDAARDLPAPVEGYRKDDTPAFCAERFRTLVEQAGAAPSPMTRRVPPFVGAATSASWPIRGGRLWIDAAAADDETAALVVEHAAGLLERDADSGRPVPAVDAETLAGRDSELIGCEIECLRAGRPVVFVDLPVAGLDDAGADASPELATGAAPDARS
ncbi:MAG: ATP-grasp domain-containing protein [Planctomycetota bacterium]|jgi:succinyl-CoA synthetase beta subunit